ncbi:CRISPR-associated endonuclease Cas2 [Candidatus Daviesbacteria bacterium RIFCSPLOWO2_02_FULL_41_8]|uniref:CRISPR-associated endonuclease Cas2 n=3 Tax=Candidatus Daviesiibacteriota TaxID=1752718 RepID=A0A1F5NKF0_9BACT|nr:MAG: CRISPR-associated endonuclease Cas2 [Candidatus Daviesbacteria bacterium RIFCSPHIGHO2_01_FULL_41_23]OGE32891.1 MAG: CRISPR-associated endonuclease Cas2 [Candidatus Daviesbacteria bacterium RIFCSPHIGHO2_02_FULL_41_10]OGE62392.1 MAG: CRISPR-associated endonuclease Cas2 [Candidatus Daviesbacteria bacterium RIFCSPLOWO2_01_FULL_41_32]OGE77992.1 MAG: CRISPR-associated endonuclease Cas2 [Candidatus Daviesbacteria bacterium RIFCSPLOWO2_02_FULL_41_8]
MGKRSKTTDLLLSVLEKTIDSSILLYDFAYNTHHYVNGEPNLDRYQLYHIVHRLKEKGWIETSRNEGRILVKLTGKGRNQLAIEKALIQKKWDGNFRIVIFDIPEKHRKVRNVFRHRLKEWGFRAWQKSVWASQKDLAEHLRNFIKELGIEDWVLVLVSKDVGNARKFVDRQ